MAAFPTNPTNGQQATVNGITYTYTVPPGVWAVTTVPSGNATVSQLNATTVVASGTVSAATVNSTGNITGGNVVTSGNMGVGTTTPAVRLQVAGASILSNATGIDPDDYVNAVVAGALADGSGFGLTSAIGGNAGTGDSWALGHNGGALFLGMGNGTEPNSLTTYMQLEPNRNMFLVPNSGGRVGIGTTTPSVSLDIGSRTDGIRLPSGTTEQRPGTPSNGIFRLNTSLGTVEFYDASAWKPISVGYTIEYVVVAGGGAGGNNHAGGGGGGGYRSSVIGESSGGGASAEATINTFPGTVFNVIVGGGGTASGTGANNNTNGVNSSFGTIVSVGGGAGGNRNDTAGTSPGQNGGSGGGGGGAQTAFSACWVAGSGTAGQGFGGGTATDIFGGGGGGAGAVGQPGAGGGSRVGGAGVQSSINGTPTFRAGGGGGSSGNTPAASGGSGGGGTAGTTSGSSGTAGGANTGGGGGGGGAGNTTGSNGGSGIVIIRYIGSQRGSGGTVTTSGIYTIHTFTTSGTFTA